MKKITLATIKSFIRKNKNNLLIKTLSCFDGSIDGTKYLENAQYEVTEHTDEFNKYNLGISGAWFVGGSRDYFTLIETNNHFGYRVYNSCRSFEIVIQK